MAAKRPKITYTPELAAEICERLASGESLRSICKSAHMPDEKAVRYWAAQPDHPFSEHYIRAREIGYLAMADEILEIADDGSNDWMEREGKNGEPAFVLNGEHVQRSRLRVDTRKWVLAKMLPKVFGDKQVLEHTGKDGGAIEIADSDRLDQARRVAFALGRALERQRMKVIDGEVG